jgi:glycolate oxidase
MAKNEYSKVFNKLSKIVGSGKVKKTKSPKKILVKPNASKDVSKLLSYAMKEEIPVVPERQRDWFSDVTSSKGCIILSIKDMNEISKIDEDNLSVTVGPGVKWKKLYNTLSKKKFSIGAYPGAYLPMVGDWIDRGGAGIGSYKYGSAEEQVRSMEVVLPNGTITNTGFDKVLPNSSGYNLNGMFIGAETTLGVITKVTLKLFPASGETRSLSYRFSEMGALGDALHELARLKNTPLDISFFDSNHFHVLKSFKKNVQVPSGVVLSVTIAGKKPILAYDEKQINTLIQKHGGQKEEQKAAQTLWEERFLDFGEKGNKPVFSEVLIPASNLLGMMKDTTPYIKSFKGKAAITGSFCDRSTIMLMPYVLSGKDKSLSKEFVKKIGELSFKHSGRPIGPSTNLKRVYGDGMDTILDIKSALDPRDIMNPERVK